MAELRTQELDCGHGNARVVAVVVTYHANEQALANLWSRLYPQVSHVVQVDNTDNPSLGKPTTRANGAHITLQLGVNTGIGHAQNLGIARARELGATHVLLLDQDSLPPPELVPQLLQTLTGAETDRVAAVGPVCRDVKTGRIIPLIQRKGWRIRRTVPTGPTPALPVAYMPASGTLIPMAILDQIGGMRAEYFIDRVDVEWCLRAGQLGFVLWVDPSVEMLHDQGTESVELPGRTMYVGHEFRRYFHVRNSLAMALRAPIPLFWRLDQLIKTPLYVLFYSAIAHTGRLRTARLLLRGVADAMAGRMDKGFFENRPLR